MAGRLTFNQLWLGAGGGRGLAGEGGEEKKTSWNSFFLGPTTLNSVLGQFVGARVRGLDQTSTENYGKTFKRKS